MHGWAVASCLGFPDLGVACSAAADACSSCLDVAAVAGVVAAVVVVVVVAAAAAAGPDCRHQSRPLAESRRPKGGARASARRS